jgi:hypothetical protein
MTPKQYKIGILAAAASILPACAAHLTAPAVAAAAKNSPAVSAAAHPVYVSKMPITKYNLFATGGWDGNWYVGSNQAWIEKINLGGYKKKDFARAYVGAKLGRMKTQNTAGKPAWIRSSYPGEIYAAAASTPAWSPSDYLLLTKTADIPSQYDYENAIDTIGEARWFWVECPLDKLNFGGDNYIAVWSPNEYLDSVSSAPILAAAWGDREVDSWINTTLGQWPHLATENPLKTPISVFEPAIAVKLVPSGTVQEVKVEIINVEDTPAAPDILKKITAAVYGFPTEKAWLEISGDSKTWIRSSMYIYSPPYVFVFDPKETAAGKISLRVAVENIRGERGFSKPVDLIAEKK